jgi:hypothetical protein
MKGFEYKMLPVPEGRLDSRLAIHRWYFCRANS